MNLPIYLDNAATTPIDPQVAEIMMKYLTLNGCFGNPSSGHSFGRAAATAVEKARTQVAELINADANEIIWTSGATEADNLAIKGIAYYYRDKGRHIVTCLAEHDAVIGACRQLEREGFEVTYLKPEASGLINPEKFKAALRPDTILASVMHVNNETGVIQDIAELGTLLRDRGIFFHVDAAQSIGKLPIDLQELPVDLMAFCAHKIYGPKGIGGLYVRPQVNLLAQIHGGGQERGLRSGTLPTHQIVGIGEAFALAKKEMAEESNRITQLRQQLWSGIQSLGNVYLNGDSEQRVAGILNVSFGEVDMTALLPALKDLAISTGSACHAGTLEPSRVLTAMGVRPELARNVIRFSIGRFTTEQEIDFAVKKTRKAVIFLRDL